MARGVMEENGLDALAMRAREDWIGGAQRLIVEVLRGHDAILDEPPPMVLVDALGAAHFGRRGNK